MIINKKSITTKSISQYHKKNCLHIAFPEVTLQTSSTTNLSTIESIRFSHLQSAQVHPFRSENSKGDPTSNSQHWKWSSNPPKKKLEDEALGIYRIRDSRDFSPKTLQLLQISSKFPTQNFRQFASLVPCLTDAKGLKAAYKRKEKGNSPFGVVRKWSTKGTPKLDDFIGCFMKVNERTISNWMISWKWFIQFKSGCLTWMIYITNLY